MAEITRPGNVQAFASAAQGVERTVFGGTNQSDLLADNLTTEFLRGWAEGVDINGFPPEQFFNAVSFTATQLTSYLFQRGIPQWHTAQEYYHFALVTGSDNEVYKSVQDSTGQDPTTDTSNTYWELLAPSITVPDASTTVKGLVEIATDTEFNNGTNTGGTGAQLVATPGQIQGAIGSDGVVSQLGNRTSTGNWTLNNITVSKPIFLNARTVDTLAHSFRVVSGATAPFNSSTTAFWELGPGGATNATSGGSSVLVPHSSTVVLNIGAISSGSTIYAWQ